MKRPPPYTQAILPASIMSNYVIDELTETERFRIHCQLDPRRVLGDPLGAGRWGRSFARAEAGGEVIRHNAIRE